MATSGAIPLGLSAYQRADLPPVQLRNFYYEKTPVNLQDQVVLISRPRLKLLATVGDGPIRGLYRKNGSILGRQLTVSGTNLYRVESGTGTLIGEVDGEKRMSAEGNAMIVVLTCGQTAYTTDGVTIDPIAMPDDQHVTSVDTLNSYFLLSVSNSGRFYWSAIGGTTVDALDYATAESQPDGLTALKVIGDELILVGRTTIEFWQPTGDLDLPFQRIQGRTFGIGSEYADTIQKLLVNGLDTLCFAGSDGKVYRTAPNPQPISDHSMEERIARATGPLYSSKASWRGHDFYILHIPGEGSFAYDMATGFWDEWTSHDRALFRGDTSGVGSDDQPVLGDDEEGILWELTESERTDNGEPVLFEFTGLLENTGLAVRINNIELDVSTGQTPDVESDPMMTLAWSFDDGATFSDERPEPLGRQGKRATRVMWKKGLGMIKRRRIHRWRTLEPVTVRKAAFNQPYH